MKQKACLLGLAWALVCIAPSTACAQCLGDFNNDGKVTINEIIVAVNNALNGCPGSGQRFVDNGDGTVTDHKTGLMWEKKDNLDGTANPIDPHDADNIYAWSSTGTAPDGALFTDFVSKVNACVSADGSTVTGGFAGHCDWRLPTIEELSGMVDMSAAGCGSGSPCIDPTFGPTQANVYWSATTNAGTATSAWYVDFYNGNANIVSKPDGYCGRAVRGGF